MVRLLIVFLVILTYSFMVNSNYCNSVSPRLGFQAPQQKITYTSAPFPCTASIARKYAAIDSLLKAISWHNNFPITSVSLCEINDPQCSRGYTCLPFDLKHGIGSFAKVTYLVNAPIAGQCQYEIAFDGKGNRVWLWAGTHCWCFFNRKIPGYLKKCKPPKVDIALIKDKSSPMENNENACKMEQQKVATTLLALKGDDDEENSLPRSRITYIEYDKPSIGDNGIKVPISINADPYNANNEGPHGSTLVTDLDMFVYSNIIMERCESGLPEKTCDGTANLLGALKEAQNQFNLPPKGSDKGRDQYMVIFSNCKVSEKQRVDICDKFENYVRTGQINADRGANQAGKGINVIMINHGEVFTDDMDDHIMCLVEYDDRRIYQSSNTNLEDFEKYGLEETIINTICESPTPAPTTDPTIDPTIDPTRNPTTAPAKIPSSTDDPTLSPSTDPTASPSIDPTTSPSTDPTSSPSTDPTKSSPSTDPTTSPSTDPTASPSIDPTTSPSTDPTTSPSTDPTKSSPVDPTTSPSTDPTTSPSTDPTKSPSTDPTKSPSTDPTRSPTVDPTQSTSSGDSQSAAMFLGNSISEDKFGSNNNGFWMLSIVVLIVMIFMNIICCTSCITFGNNAYNRVNMIECDVEEFDVKNDNDEKRPIYQ